MANKLITKSIFLNYLACPALAWFEHHSTQPKTLTTYEKLQVEEGEEIGRLARSLFPGGILIEANSNELAAKQTQIHMQDSGVGAIFEATFIANGFICKADILLRDKNKWILIEVKSSLHDSEKIDKDHIDDIAYTTFVTKSAGLNIGLIAIMRLSKNYRLGQPVENLFKTLDCKKEVEQRAKDFEILPIIDFSQKPKAILIKNCKACDYFKSECIGKDLSHPIIELPRITAKKLRLLNDSNIIEIREIEDSFDLTPSQKRVVEAVKAMEAILDKNILRDFLSKLTYPYYFLDFEAVLTALPIYPEIAPHQVVLTQYSLHILDSESAQLRHFEYLAPHNKESRKELIEDLLVKLGKEGSVSVYSNYEETQLKAVAESMPDLKAQIDAIISRLFDLHKIFTDAYYHPDFCGSTSIKKVLPVLVPDLSYNGLEIGDGGEAVAQFVKMAKGLCKETEVSEIRKNLLEYCKLDTLAMVRLHRCIEELIN